MSREPGRKNLARRSSAPSVTSVRRRPSAPRFHRPFNPRRRSRATRSDRVTVVLSRPTVLVGRSEENGGSSLRTEQSPVSFGRRDRDGVGGPRSRAARRLLSGCPGGEATAQEAPRILDLVAGFSPLAAYFLSCRLRPMLQILKWHRVM